MTSSPARIALLALVTTGCTGPSGIWLLDIPWQDGGSDCNTEITDNFTNGYVPGQDGGGASDWTYGDAYEGADSIGFAQIETYGDGSAVLVMGTVAYPGVQDADGWTFAFQAEEQTADWADHNDGYGWKITNSSTTDTTYTFTMDSKNVATVEVEGEATTVELWEETDVWDIDQVGVDTQLEFDQWLVYDDPDFGQEAQENNWEEADCEGDLCTLRFTTTCSSSGEFTATRTDYDNSDYYDYLSGVGQ